MSSMSVWKPFMPAAVACRAPCTPTTIGTYRNACSAKYRLSEAILARAPGPGRSCVFTRGKGANRSMSAASR